MFESCVQIRSHFSDYLDGLCEPEALKSIRFHLTYCNACQDELDRSEVMVRDLRALPRRRVTPEVALALRVNLSQRLHRNLLSGLRVRFENALRPLLIPASGGVLAAIICFFFIMGYFVVPTVHTPDVPLAVVTPPRVEELPPINFDTGDKAVFLVTHVDAGGRVIDYHVLSGQNSPELMHSLDRLIYFSRFQPATLFGKPTDGQVILSLRRITVRG